MKLPCGGNRANDIVTALDDDGRDIAYLVHVLQEEILAFKERVVHKVMAFDACKSERLVGAFPMLHQIFAWIKFRGRTFPNAPGTRGRKANALIIARKPFVIGRDHIAAFFFWDLVAISFPIVRKYLGRAVLVEPLKLLAPR